MAYERNKEQKIKGESLDVFVENISKTFSQQIATRNAEDEANFNEAVLNSNLSLDEQLNYRKEQLTRVDDPTERRRIRSEIATLKDRIEQKKYSDSYLEKLNEYQTGLSSVDSVINWLNDYKNTTSDSTVIDSINKQLVDLGQQKFSLTKELMKSTTDYALNDKTETVLNNQISKITTEKNKALLAGDETLVANYNLQLQALQKAKIESSISNDVKDMAVQTMTNNSSAINLLDSYNTKIASSSTDTPITVGGVTYKNAKEFWTYKRDSYLSDSSSDGFFNRFNDEQTSSIKVKNSNNTLSTNDLLTSKSNYDSLASRSEIQPYLQKVELGKQDTLQTGANLISGTIYNNVQQDYDINKALGNLEVLKGIGTNIQDTETKIINLGSQIKSQQVENISNVSNEYGITPEEAVKTGAATVVSPKENISKPATEIISTAQKNAGTATEDTRTTYQPVNTTATTTPATSTQNTTTTTTTPTPSVYLNKQLDFGTTDTQVKELQKFLNKQGFIVSSSGAGSVGNETDYFGPATQAALKKFQETYGIVSSGDAITTGYGRLGPQTLKKIQELSGIK